ESGTQNITATVSSKAGITAEAADPVELTVKPQQPVIDIDPFVATLKEIKGTVVGAKAGDEVTVLNGSKELGKAIVGENGEWTLTLETALTNENLTLTTTVTSGGVISEVSVPVEVAVDNTKPTDLVINAITDGKVFGDSTTITGTVTGANGGTVT
ncbi:hypothetical protein, partial [Pseudomonas sp. HY7a-MNA-CIBAN-0227]|uniref:hypothetical protein n=1 Tax=Pseudomonas sp. HY7a-MNA-CIBAN-0227 TaxID=3140474 RepID=UPI00331BF4B2